MILSELKTRLEHIDPAHKIAVNELTSYRGFYHHAALAPEHRKEYMLTVGQLLKEVEYALKEGNTFEGYKGGNFQFDEFTPIWVSEYGESSGVALIAIEYNDIDDYYQLVTADISYY